MVGGGGGGGNNKVVATLRADGKVYPTESASIGQLASLMNYKIRTENELAGKSLSTLSIPTTVVDLGKQLLQYARDSDLKGVKNMLSRGAPFTSDWLGMSALHFAAMNNQFEICDALLKGGINKDWKTKVDRTPLHFACFYGNERIVELLLSKNCAVNPKDMLRMTPLHWAIEKRFKSVVRLLLKHNADVTLSSKFGRTPIALAVLTEQADLLEELEAVRQTQVNRKFNEETEKETSDAVNSIMGLADDIIEEPYSVRKMDLDNEDELTNQSEYVDVKIDDFSNIKETGVLDNTTINLLKSHGISMMQDDDDTSKDLLTTALKNGRQLVLSEGGKLLLDEAKRIQNNQNIKNNNNNNNSNNNNNNKIMPIRLKSEMLNLGTTTNSASVSNVSTAATQHISKVRPTIITKAKDSLVGNRNKNIRIISLNDFKKLYGNSPNLKTVQTWGNTRVVRQIPEDAKLSNAERKMFVNLRQVQNRQPKVLHSDTASQDDNIIEEDEADAMTNIIQMVPTDSEAEASDTDQKMALSNMSTTTATTTAPVRLMPVANSRRVEQVLQQPHHMRQNVATAKQQATAQTTQQLNALMKTTGGVEKVKSQQQSSTSSSSSSIIPLLTTPEICRQLFELRKQNEELRRKFEFAQKEKEQMRQRLERLEEFFLIEKSNDDYAES